MERLLRAIAYIEVHLLEPLPLADVARAAGLSPAYLSRLFPALTSESFGAYVRKRRLTIAAQHLCRDGRSVRLLDLALDCQYDSQEAFTRAFKRAFGVPPGAYRDLPRPDRMRWREPLDVEALTHLTEVICMEPKILEKEAFVVVGLRRRFDDETKSGIPALWGELLARLADIPHGRPGTYAVCLNPDPQQGVFDYVAGVEVARVDALPEGMVAETVPRQTYAVFTHRLRSRDVHADLQPTLRWIWGTWLPSSRYEYTGGPDLERYAEDFDPNTPGASIEILVPVRPEDG